MTSSDIPRKPPTPTPMMQHQSLLFVSDVDDRWDSCCCTRLSLHERRPPPRSHHGFQSATATGHCLILMLHELLMIKTQLLTVPSLPLLLPLTLLPGSGLSPREGMARGSGTAAAQGTAYLVAAKDPRIYLNPPPSQTHPTHTAKFWGEVCLRNNPARHEPSAFMSTVNCDCR